MHFYPVAAFHWMQGNQGPPDRIAAVSIADGDFAQALSLADGSANETWQAQLDAEIGLVCVRQGAV